MTVLDATTLDSENDLTTDIDTGEELASEIESGEETTEEIAESAEPSAANATLEPGPVRQFTLDLPAEAETTIKIIAQQGTVCDCAWRVVYQIERKYETSPHEQHNIDEAVINLEAEGVNHLGYAILQVIDEAALWLSTHSDDNDTKAQTSLHFLETWYDELDVESVTEAIFDPLPEPVKVAEVAEVASETPADACGCDKATKPTAVTVTTNAVVGSLNQAVLDFDEQRLFLQNRLCILLGEEESISEELKEVRQSRKRVAKQYHEHLAKGPERLPLIDSQPQPVVEQEEEEEEEEQADATPAVVESDEPAEPLAAEDESWRDVLVDKTNIPAAICKILNEDNQVYTLGQLADVTAEPNTSLTDLKKIGQAKADRIEEAMCEYWAANPRK